MDRDFLVRPDELTRRFLHTDPPRRLSFVNTDGDFATWRDACKTKLAELLGLEPAEPGEVTELRRTTHDGVTVVALAMRVHPDLSVPAYLLRPESDARPTTAAMAVHGHNIRTGAGAPGRVRLVVTPGSGHTMDITALLAFFGEADVK